MSNLEGQPAGKTILMVDPNIQVILTVTRMLSPRGFYVRAARDGRHALEIYEQNKKDIDLVLLEQELPGPSVLEVMNALLRINANLPIIVMSASGSPDLLWRTRLPRGGFLSKPFTPDQLVQCVWNTLSTETRKEEGEKT